MSATRASLMLIVAVATCLLTSAAACDPRSSWRNGPPVRVAIGPGLRSFPEPLQPDEPPALVHRYAKLVQQRSGLSFLRQSHASTAAAIAAVCARQADLALVHAPRNDLQPPCAGLIESRTFLGGDTLLARDGDAPLIERIETALQAISIEDHAALLLHWMPRLAPVPLNDRPATTAAWALPATGVALLASVVSMGIYWRQRKRMRTQRQNQVHASSLVNHEVRNAAQAMVSAVDLLRQSPLPDGARELVSIAAGAGQNLRGLLDRALDFSRLASGSFQPQPRPCDLAALCAASIQTALPQARQKGLALQFSPVGELPPLLLDPECLRQILDNLLGNALKFTDVGSIELRATLQASQHPALLQVEVIDSGVGIAAAQMTALFAPYRQGDAGRQRGGSGLGLSICRKLAQAMGGTLDAHSVHGSGSCFTLCLPVQIRDGAALVSSSNAD